MRLFPRFRCVGLKHDLNDVSRLGYAFWLNYRLEHVGFRDRSYYLRSMSGREWVWVQGHSQDSSVQWADIPRL